MCALMKIALTQQETAWEDPAANMRACARLAEDAARAGAALVVFPEFTLTGFTPRPRAFADAPGAALQLDFFRARALETQCYLVGVNRAGSGGGIAYAPSSVVFDPTGQRLTPPTPDELILCDLDPRRVREVRAAFPLRSDRRDDLYPSLVCRDYTLAATQKTGV